MLPSSACLWSAEDKCVGGRGNSEGFAPTGTGHLAVASMSHMEPQPAHRPIAKWMDHRELRKLHFWISLSIGDPFGQ